MQACSFAYATSPGSVALDGAGSNSPYTKYLAQSMSAPNLSIEDTFKRTLKGVYVETHGEQTPWISSTFFGDLVFRPTSAPPAASAPSPAPAPPSPMPAPNSQGALLSPVPFPAAMHAQPNALPPAAKPIELTGVYRVRGTNPSGSQYHGMLSLL